MALPSPSTGGIALITGASSGIGAAIARELASRGHAVALVARREERLRSLASDLTAEHGVTAAPLACDLADASDRDRLHDELRGLNRYVEVLVNNAGFGSRGRFTEKDPGRMVEMVRLNVEAVVDLSSRFLPGMAERGRGAVINIASTAAFQPMPGGATYAATKSFVLSFSEAIHTEQRSNGVTVTAVCPGPVKTEFTEVAGMAGVENETPEVFWMSAEDIGRHAVEGTEQGKRVVVPGALNRAQSLMGQHTPRALALPLIDKLWTSATSRGSLDP
jgi:short-subunit dehydrogenase